MNSGPYNPKCLFCGSLLPPRRHGWGKKYPAATEAALMHLTDLQRPWVVGASPLRFWEAWGTKTKEKEAS